MITHVVLFKFNQGTSDQDIQTLLEGLGELPQQIEEIREFRFGRDVIHSERSCDLGLVSSFDDLDALQRYQTHPLHQQLLVHIKAICDSIAAVDFEG
jgi:hypothetical protein